MENRFWSNNKVSLLLSTLYIYIYIYRERERERDKERENERERERERERTRTQKDILEFSSNATWLGFYVGSGNKLIIWVKNTSKLGFLILGNMWKDIHFRSHIYLNANSKNIFNFCSLKSREIIHCTDSFWSYIWMNDLFRIVWAFLLSVCQSICLYICLFTFSSFPKTLGQFQPNCTQIIFDEVESSLFKKRVTSFPKGR